MGLELHILYWVLSILKVIYRTKWVEFSQLSIPLPTFVLKSDLESDISSETVRFITWCSDGGYDDVLHQCFVFFHLCLSYASFSQLASNAVIDTPTQIFYIQCSFFSLHFGLYQGELGMYISNITNTAVVSKESFN